MSGKTLSLRMAGRLSEDAQLKAIDLSAVDAIDIDLNELSNISSQGVRTWIQWVDGIDRKKTVSLVNCPKVFVNMLNLVHDIAPPHVKIKSIGVPYFCTKCGHAFCENLELNEHTPKPIVEFKPCNSCDGTAELDTLPEKYFRFLKERA